MIKDIEKNILMVVPKYSYENIYPAYDYVFPLGLAYIVSSMMNKGLSVEVLNLNHKFGDSCEILQRKLDDNTYFAVCTGGNSMIFNQLREIIKTASFHSSHPITVLGGIVVTSEPDIVFNAIKPDYAVMGEGEISVPELFFQLLAGEKPETVPGTIFLKNGFLKKVPLAREFQDIDSIPFPELDKFGFNDWLDHQLASGMGDTSRIYPVLGSRGCPFKCTFCYHYEKYRERSLDNIFEELEGNLQKYRANSILLYDDCFSLNTDRLKDFCFRILHLQGKLGYKLYWGVQLTVKGINKEILKILKRSGCTSISFGFESFSQVVLDSMKKPIKTDEIINALELTLKFNLNVQGNFIFGDVAETTKSYRETLEFWKNHCQGQVNLDIIRLYPGSPVYKQSIERGIIKNPLTFLEEDIPTQRAINFTTGMSDKEYFIMLMDIFETKRRFGVFVIPKSIKKNGNQYDVLLECPFCKAEFNCRNIHLNLKYNGLGFASFHCSCRSCIKRFIVMSRLGYIYMKTKSIRYRLVKLIGFSLSSHIKLLIRNLEKAP